MVVFLGVVLGYMRFGVDPSLQYQATMPLFYSGPVFFSDFEHRPGGLLGYAVSYAEQFFVYSWVGALIVTGLVGLVGLLMARLVTLTKGKSEQAGEPVLWVGTLALVPMFLSFVIAARLELSWVPACVGAVLALAGAVVVMALRAAPRWVSVVCFGVLAGVLNSVSGILAGALFTIVCAMGLWSARRDWVGSVTQFTIGSVLSISFWAHYKLSVPTVMAELGTEDSRLLTAWLYLAVPMIILLNAIPARVRPEAKPVQQPGKLKKGKNATPAAAERKGMDLQGIGAVMASVVLVAGAIWSASGNLDRGRKAQLAVERAVAHEDWDAVLAAGKEVKNPDWSTRLEVRRALYHKGQLLEQLFDWPQVLDLGMLPDQPHGMQSTPAFSATLLELGHYNLAEHMAHEGLELLGDRPDLIKTIVKVNVLKDRPKAARVYLGLLRKNPVEREWAEEFLKRLDQDPTMAGDPEISHLRSLKITTDYPSNFEPGGVLLEQALDSNPNNRMAAEYLVAHYLLLQKPQSVLQKLSALGTGVQLPRAVEEALLDLELGQEKRIDLGRRAIRPESYQRLDRFRKAYTGFKGKEEAARSSLASEFGNTYWYFSCFGETANSINHP